MNPIYILSQLAKMCMAFERRISYRIIAGYCVKDGSCSVIIKSNNPYRIDELDEFLIGTHFFITKVVDVCGREFVAELMYTGPGDFPLEYPKGPSFEDVRDMTIDRTELKINKDWITVKDYSQGEINMGFM